MLGYLRDYLHYAFSHITDAFTLTLYNVSVQFNHNTIYMQWRSQTSVDGGAMLTR